MVWSLQCFQSIRHKYSNKNLCRILRKNCETEFGLSHARYVLRSLTRNTLDEVLQPQWSIRNQVWNSPQECPSRYLLLLLSWLEIEIEGHCLWWLCVSKQFQENPIFMMFVHRNLDYKVFLNCLNQLALSVWGSRHSEKNVIFVVVFHEPVNVTFP